MQYFDKNKKEIKEGMVVRLSDGTTEQVYKTINSTGENDLGINASNEKYLQAHSYFETDRECYPLYAFPQDEFEVVETPGKDKEKHLRVLMVEPMKKPYVKELDGSLESLQGAVGGLIQIVYPFDDNVGIVCNDEGKLMGLPPNRFLKDDRNVPYDVICGTFFVAGLNEDDFTSLTDKQIAKYSDMYSKELLISKPKEKKPKQHER